MSLVLQDLSFVDVGIVVVFVVVNGVILVVLLFGFGCKFVFVVVCIVVQLFVIGYVFGWVFGYLYWYVVLLFIVLMMLIVGFVGVGCGKCMYCGQCFDSIVLIWFSSWFVVVVGLFVVICIYLWFVL